jgi:hypothetical protein
MRTSGMVYEVPSQVKRCFSCQYHYTRQKYTVICSLKNQYHQGSAGIFALLRLYEKGTIYEKIISKRFLLAGEK